MGLCERPEDAAKETPYNPFFCYCVKAAELSGHQWETGERRRDRYHFALIVYVADAQSISHNRNGGDRRGSADPGSVAWEVLREEARDRERIWIGHPSGKIPVESVVKTEEGRVTLEKIGVYRTARRILDGRVYLPER